MKDNIKWLVLLTSTTGFGVDDYESTYCIASFDTQEEAEEFISNYCMGPYDITLAIVRGRDKNN